MGYSRVSKIIDNVLHLSETRDVFTHDPRTGRITSHEVHTSDGQRLIGVRDPKHPDYKPESEGRNLWQRRRPTSSSNAASPFRRRQESWSPWSPDKGKGEFDNVLAEGSKKGYRHDTTDIGGGWKNTHHDGGDHWHGSYWKSFPAGTQDHEIHTDFENHCGSHSRSEFAERNRPYDVPAGQTYENMFAGEIRRTKGRVLAKKDYDGGLNI